MDGLDRPRLFRRGVCRRRSLSRRHVLQVRLSRSGNSISCNRWFRRWRSRSAQPIVCASCTTHECIRGSTVSRLPNATLSAAQVEQHGLHVLSRLRPRLPARQRRHPCRLSRKGTVARSVPFGHRAVRPPDGSGGARRRSRIRRVFQRRGNGRTGAEWDERDWLRWAIRPHG